MLMTTEAASAHRITLKSSGPRWHVVHCEAKGEKSALTILKRYGYDYYAPMLRTYVTPPRKSLSRAQRRHVHLMRRQVLKPLFPRYLFVRFDVERDPWHDIFRFVGIHGMVCAGDLPYPLPDVVIERLMGLELDGAIPTSTSAQALFYAVGETVRVSDGPFAGFDGAVEEIDESGRVLILMAMFGRKVRVRMDDDQLEKL